MSADDKNFDELFERFRRNIKTQEKGRLRETLIRDDLLQCLPQLESQALDVWDVGCGLGDMSAWFASLGHRVRASDLSVKMYEHTLAFLAERGLAAECFHESAQESLSSGGQADLICLHAVLEWLAEPYQLLASLAAALRPGGYVSLTVYNLHRSVFNSLVKGNLEKIRHGDYSNHNPKSLSPPNPIIPSRVRAELVSLGFHVELEAGIRCFYDYLSEKNKADIDDSDILLLERRYRHESPYRDFARYVHIIARKV